MITEVVTDHFLGRLLSQTLPAVIRPRFLGCSIWKRSDRIRVSIAAILRLGSGGKWVLIRNHLRKETFAPIGGVIKTRATSRDALDALDFEPQDSGNHEGMINDLRGFLPRKNLPKFIQWLETNQGRESGEQCLHREIVEELKEIGYTFNLPSAFDLGLHLVRTVEEGPEKVPGHNYTQYRRFEVYESRPEQKESVQFLDDLCMSASGNANMITAETREVRSGRNGKGLPISHHAAYFFGKERVHFGAPPFITK